MTKEYKGLKDLTEAQLIKKGGINPKPSAARPTEPPPKLTTSKPTKTAETNSSQSQTNKK